MILFGRELAQRYGREGLVALSVDVSLVKGKPEQRYAWYVS
jgi:hypothetical protein